jgi:hypothetical protein
VQSRGRIEEREGLTTMGCAASSVAAGVGYELSEKEAAELAVLEPHEEVRVVVS